MEAVVINGEDSTVVTPMILTLSYFLILQSRAKVLYCAMVSGFDSVHLRTYIPRLEEAVKDGNSAGDRYNSPLSFNLQFY